MKDGICRKFLDKRLAHLLSLPATQDTRLPARAAHAAEGIRGVGFAFRTRTRSAYIS